MNQIMNQEPALEDIAAAMVDDAEDMEPVQDEAPAQTEPEQQPEEPEAPEMAASEDEGEQENPDREETGEADPEPDHSQSQWTPPIGMSAAEQETFRNLPPEAQEYVVRREQDRERFFGTKSNELAEEKRASEALKAETDSMKAQLKEALSHWASSDLKLPDANLAVENPVEYSRQFAEYTAAKEKREEAKEQLKAIGEAEQKNREAEHNKWVEAEAAKLRQMVPEFANPDTASKTHAAISDYASKAWGIAPEQLAQLDAMSIAVLNKARLYDASQAQAASVRSKAKPAPKSAKPGTPKGTNTKSRTIENFEKNPSVDSLAALFTGG